ncbi:MULTISPECIES: choice-of-anchor A family protein [unclassified Streptomyces]|uniref:choice-of-anchor A family protein n=1 Tax=unclassified Streptomyces TaxID=2593676 RepID=UPI000DAF20FA|nr:MULTISPECIES: choice-of-anchor A family protein [unclassified Streptomyces]PZT72466.1 cell wall protein [Streptomyces sp. AC1-42T]PZT81216.1 cell wall protein [Streptomyces sp. AC1-42W]
MRIPTSAALAALGGALVLGLTVAPAAQAAPATADCTTDAFGIAGKYGEFVLGDDVHSPDAEGAVAVGGNADFRGGFSVGNELTAAQVDALPGRASLVVRGDLLNGGSATVVMKGNAVVGGAVKDRAVELHNGSFSQKADLIDFDAEFTKLRAYSDALAKESATSGAEVKLDGSRLTFTGTDDGRNVFTVPASQLEQAKDIFIKVPAGATTIINVTGQAYDMAAAGTTGFFLSGGQDFVLDDKLQSANGGAVRAKLLWNFPDATKIVKSSKAAWPGSVLAPDAHLELGTAAPVNGSVWVASLHGSGGAETHHFPFTGCLPEVPGTPSTPSPSTTPSGTPSTTPPATATPSASVPPSGSATPSGTPSGTTTPGAPAPSASPSEPGDGDLAETGSSNMIPITIGGALVVAAGASMVVVARRRKRA